MANDSANHVLPLLDEALNLFGSMVCALTYGITLTMYCMCTRSLCRRLRKPSQRKAAQVTLIYTTFAIICGTVYLGMTHYVIQMAYVFHRDHPGGPLAFEAFVLGAQPPYITSMVLMAMLDWLTLGIQIWRLWILWRTNRYFLLVIAPPIFLYLACIGIDIATISTQANMNYISLTFGYFFGFAFFGIPPLITIIVTALMIFRLLAVRRRHAEIMGEAGDLTKQYTGVIAMLVESYMLDAMWSVATIITYALPQPLVCAIFIQASVNIKAIALYMIVYRVTKGRAWRTHTEQQLSSLRWNYGAHSGTSDPDLNMLSRMNDTIPT